ncbi:hypothetical protein BGZ80_007555, partial [Entomortierella chlamydospora]
GGSEPLKTRVRGTKSKVIRTSTALAPSKNKTRASSATDSPASGSWTPAPPPANIPKSASKILECIRVLA